MQNPSITITMTIVNVANGNLYCFNMKMRPVHILKENNHFSIVSVLIPFRYEF